MSTRRKTTANQGEQQSLEAERTVREQKPIHSNALKIRLDNLGTFDPLTDNQNRFYKAYKQGDYFIALTGSPGTGKSFIALYKAVEEVLRKDNSFEKIVIVRSAVQGRDVGFTPGDLDEKMGIYEDPYHQIFSRLFNNKEAYKRCKEQGVVEFTSTTALRGMSFDNAIIIVDEMQNMNWGELNTVMTRVGHMSKIIFCGDFGQNDLTKNRSDVSGFIDFMKVAARMPEFTQIEFTPDDIVRSSLVKSWIIAAGLYH